MIRHMLRYPAGWEWHVLQQAGVTEQPQKSLPSRKNAGQAPRTVPEHQPRRSSSIPESPASAPEQRIAELKEQFPECGLWIDECASRRTNHISVDHSAGVGPILCGTLMIQITEDPSDIEPFHFWLSRHRLVTMHGDIRLPLRLQTGSHTIKYDECKLAPEAFFIMISVILETFHSGLDGFESRLGELERTMRHRNRTGLLDVIFDRRYDLLHWSHLFIPIREVHGASKEAFMEELGDTDAFKRITHKLERIETLLKHYALEIDTLISMDDAISSFRGNDIMKTLTIFTVLFLPATVIGGLWGMNFDWLPWRRQPWGYGAMLVGISVITIGIYLWLWRKGWTGDLLVKKRDKLLLLENEADQSRSRSARHGGKRKKPDTESRAGAMNVTSFDRTNENDRSRRNRT
ncbi:magnesium transporter CorA family protein [Paenibacillus sp. LHD-117]|uniref:magnesium transporter CorA family protein n=1 Tax=Paenibacillus sp. LHD-117 TaxID=3071412 RepID=UPI0027E17759|nr:magnesium transporter CorA family protein [Paenibacillus sp. LHD-117]MDQ6420074.1 magnesium transporter CorA family protein [Paenibacillus sp. LHD-117]